MNRRIKKHLANFLVLILMISPVSAMAASNVACDSLAMIAASADVDQTAHQSMGHEMPMLGEIAGDICSDSCCDDGACTVMSCGGAPSALVSSVLFVYSGQLADPLFSFSQGAFPAPSNALFRPPRA